MGNVVNIYVVKLLPSLPRTFPEYNLGWADREAQINSEKKNCLNGEMTLMIISELISLRFGQPYSRYDDDREGPQAPDQPHSIRSSYAINLPIIAYRSVKVTFRH